MWDEENPRNPSNLCAIIHFAQKARKSSDENKNLKNGMRVDAMRLGA